MFIKTNIFKRLLKEAYKGNGLVVGFTDDERYYIAGSYWCLLVRERFFTNKEKAGVIELIGNLPKKNEYFRACKNDIQTMLPDETFIRVMDDEPMELLEETPILVEEAHGVISRMLSTGNSLIPINEGLYTMVSEDEKTEDDFDVEGPYRTMELQHAVFWQNNTSILMLYTRRWEGDFADLKEEMETMMFGRNAE